MSMRNFLWKALTGEDLPASLQPEPEPASFSDSAKGMSNADVRRIVSDLVDDYYLDGARVADIPTPMLRDALYGAQNYSSPGLFFQTWSRKRQLPAEIVRRLDMGRSYRPGYDFTPTGVDMYRIQNPDMIVAPNARSYNDEWGPQ